MRKLILVSAFTLTAMLAADSTAYAQFDAAGPGSIGGVGGLTGAGPRSRGLGPARLGRSRSPVISPYLNLLPETANTFEGEFFLRTVPFEQFYNNVQSNSRSFQNQQTQIDTNKSSIEGLDAQIRSGVSTTGKSVRFMSTGRYFPGRK